MNILNEGDQLDYIWNYGGLINRGYVEYIGKRGRGIFSCKLVFNVIGVHAGPQHIVYCHDCQKSGFSRARYMLM